MRVPAWDPFPSRPAPALPRLAGGCGSQFRRRQQRASAVSRSSLTPSPGSPASRSPSSAARVPARASSTRRTPRRAPSSSRPARSWTEPPRFFASRRRARPRRNGVPGELVLIGFLAPLSDPAGIERLTQPRRRRLRDGVDPSHDPGTGDGRALLAEHRRRLQGGAARRRPAAEDVPDADDRRGHDRRPRRCSSSAPAWPGCRRSRPRGGSAPSSRRSTSDRPCAEQVEIARRDVPRPRRPRRGDRGRLRAGADADEQQAQQRRARGAYPRVRRRDHDGARPGPSGAAADPAPLRSSGCDLAQ